MKRRIDLYSLLLHIALIALAVVVLLLARENQRLRGVTATPPGGPEVGQRLEPLQWQSLDNEASTLDFSGEHRESLLLIFTTECPACQENQQAWRILNQEMGNSVNVVGISLSELEATRRYRDAHALPFPVGVLAEPQKFAASLAITKVPMTIRVGSDGRTLGVWSGILSKDRLSELSQIYHG